jgi:hypothetical protein
MPPFNSERVEHALNELLVRIVPDDPDEDEAVVNQRFDEAFDFAIGTLSRYGALLYEYACSNCNSPGEPSVVPDINHVSDLIEQRSVAPKLAHMNIIDWLQLLGVEIGLKRRQNCRTFSPDLFPNLF